MMISINGQRQMSFQQFEKAFREAFAREMSDREWGFFIRTDFSDCAPQRYAKELAPSIIGSDIGSGMFSEHVVLGGLKAGSSWFVADYILRMDSQSGRTEDVARQIADRNDLRYARAEQSGKTGFRFWRIE